MQGEKAGQGWTGDNRSAQQQIDQRPADERHAGDDRGANAQTPVGILVEAHHLAGECHAQRHQQQKHAQDPGQLARKFISAKQEDLRHVDQHHGDHEVRTPAVHGAQKPSQRELLIQHLQTVPCLARRGDVNDGQQDPGDDL